MSTLWTRTWPEQGERLGGTLLVPIGSCEQHGPHLPLLTDALVAETVCADVRRARDVDVAPTLGYSASGEHQGFPGLLSLGTEVTRLVCIEVVRSARATWSRVIFVSGHGGNVEALAGALEVARHEGDDVVAWLPTDVGGDPHAGGTETSVVLSVHPSLVRPVAVPATMNDDWRERVRAEGFAAVTSSGVLGDPSTATVERGLALRARWCAEVVALVDRVGRVG